MITISDIIMKTLEENGYRNQHDFCVKNGIEETRFSRCLRHNDWSITHLTMVGNALGKDLSKFANKKSQNRKNI